MRLLGFLWFGAVLVVVEALFWGVMLEPLVLLGPRGQGGLWVATCLLVGKVQRRGIDGCAAGCAVLLCCTSPLRRNCGAVTTVPHPTRPPHPGCPGRRIAVACESEAKLRRSLGEAKAKLSLCADRRAGWCDA